MTQESLILKYRPESLDEVVGQDEVVSALKQIIEKRSAHSFLFVGPSGCGKTTLARIAATMLGCAETREEDAATNNGIDAMRAITATLQYKPLRGGCKGLIIDEIQAASKAAFQSLLKSIEEPPEWAFWFLCTTDPDKIPKNIQTRCVRFELFPVKWQTLVSDILNPVADAEKMACSDETIGVCARLADGSPRQALVNLSLCADVADPEEAQRLLGTTISDSKEGVDLARALIKGAHWNHLMELVKKMEDQSAEGVRHVVLEYSKKVALGAQTVQQASRALAIMDAFSVPFHTAEGNAPLILAIGRLLTNTVA
jgi:DNA polymerase III gamma/tau subunit